MCKFGIRIVFNFNLFLLYMTNKFYSSLLNLQGHFRNDETLFEASLLASDQLMAHPSNELLGKSPRLVNSSDLELEF